MLVLLCTKKTAGPVTIVQCTPVLSCLSYPSQMVYQREKMASPFLSEIHWRLIISIMDYLHMSTVDLLSVGNVGFSGNKSHMMVLCCPASYRTKQVSFLIFAKFQHHLGRSSAFIFTSSLLQDLTIVNKEQSLLKVLFDIFPTQKVAS